MKMQDLPNPAGLVVTIVTEGHPAIAPRKMTGVVVGPTLVLLDSAGATGDTFGLNCLSTDTAEVLCVWASLRAYYTSAKQPV